MGKLAVPEYILNKPGKLTAAEFDKMKLHAGVGADILSAIDFPYPVVPIVRHHHENWDGTGYPTGVKGTDIPIGARILSVVDCFDALTSDRPYRPQLPDEDAIAILLERRGTMYDPLVVDTFVRVYKEIAPELTISSPAKRALIEITSSTTGQRHAELLSTTSEPAAADAMLALYEVSAGLEGRLGVADAADIIGKHLRRVVPFALFVLYLYEEAADELIAQHTLGDSGAALEGLRIPRGERLSGWVAANRQTIVNSDPALDLGNIARAAQPALRACMSTPLCVDDALFGVLALYSTAAEGFSSDHRRIVEVSAGYIAQTLRSAAEFDCSTRLDRLTGLPTLARLQHLLKRLGVSGGIQSHPHALLSIAIVNLDGINAAHGRPMGDEAIQHVAKQIQAALRTTDLLFRCSGDTFAALLLAEDAASAETVITRIHENVRSRPLAALGRPFLPIEITVSVSDRPRCVGAVGDLAATDESGSRKGSSQRVH